jgi:class 3 adenylate cyclase
LDEQSSEFQAYRKVAAKHFGLPAVKLHFSNRSTVADMAAEKNARRLCVILVADVVGFSRLMGADEDGTLAALTAHRSELIDPAVAEYAGRIVKATGDGVLVEFASAVDAVRCAIYIQCGMAARNRAVAPDLRLAFRIGLNLGDVIVQDSDLYGDGVNVAARLEAWQSQAASACRLQCTSKCRTRCPT